MNKEEFDSIIEEVLQHGISVTLSIDELGTIWYDMNTQMKSGMSIALIEDVCRYKERYGEGTINDLEDLLRIVRYCMIGRDFANSNWIDWLVEKNLLTKVVTTTVTYK